MFRFQNYVSETFQNAVGNARKKWDALKAVLDKPIFATFIAPAWDSVKASASAALTNIQNKAGAAFDNVKATISGAVDSAIDTVKNLPGTIANAMGYAAGYMYETISQLPGRIRTMVTTAGEFLRNLPRYCLEAGTSFVNTLAAWGTRAYTATVDFLTRTVTNAWETLMNLPDACYNAGVAFVNRLETWGGEAFRAAVNFLKDLDAACWRFLFNLPKICMEAGQKFVSAASKWAQDAYNSIMEWILKLPEAISNTISNAWENIKSKFSAGFTVGVSAAANNAQPVAANAKGGIYNQGAFLTTFAEKSPEAAIPIDNSDRAKGLWFRTGQMLGMIQKPMRRSATPALKLPGTFPANTGYEPKPSLPKLNIPDSIKAVGQLTANLSVPGVFGALVKWLQRPGKKDEEPGGLPAFPAQPAPIVNALAATPNVQVAPTVPNIAPVINAMAKAPDVVVNAAAPAKERKNVPVIRNIIQAVADSPVVRNVVNAVAEVPDVIVNAAAPVINTPMAASPVVNVPDAEAPQVNVSPVIQALANAPAVSAIFDPVVQSAGMPDINLPDLPVQKETLIERIKEFVTNSPARKEQAAPTFVVNNEFHFSGNVNEKEVRETVDRATDITAAKFRELMQQYMREERRRCYG